MIAVLHFTDRMVPAAMVLYYDGFFLPVYILGVFIDPHVYFQACHDSKKWFESHIEVKEFLPLEGVVSTP